MKISAMYVVHSDDGRHIPWGLPGFDDPETAAGFLAFVREELEEGAAAFCAARRRDSVVANTASRRLWSGAADAPVALEKVLSRLLTSGHARLAEQAAAREQILEQASRHERDGSRKIKGKLERGIER